MTPEEFTRRLSKLALRDGMTFATLATLGVNDRSVVVATIAAKFDPAALYAEPEVNQRLKDWLASIAANVATDHVSLRRWLVDTQVLSRTDECTDYRLAPAALGRLRDIAKSLDCQAIAERVRLEDEQARVARKAAWLQRAGEQRYGDQRPPDKD